MTLAVLPTIPHRGKEQVARGGDDIDEGGPRFAEAEVQTDAASPLHDDDHDDERETLVESFGPPSSPGARSSPGSGDGSTPDRNGWPGGPNRGPH